MSQPIDTFVYDALAKGLDRPKIKTALKHAGWSDDEVKQALEAYHDVDFPIPVPKRKPYLSAREAFMYLLMFLTLYISAFSFGTILFQTINIYLPDTLLNMYSYYYDGARQTIRWSTAALIIAYPLFLWISYVLNKAISKDAAKRASKIRKWLTYITLFIAAGVIIGDLIGLVYNFLGGELTLRFILKVLTVGVISGSIFGYYLWDLRKEEKES
ncbi:hypothetical protein HZC53_03355 [Candidatus Uhrbacteria bacterium]|nr:hypothetical protein [Candidatus Uhrbacteria bacterium]